MNKERKRIAVLCGGGDCPGLNAVIRAVVKTALFRYGWEVLGSENSFDGFLDPERIRPLTLDTVRGILPRGGTILGTTNRGNPFRYPILNEEGEMEFQDVSSKVVERIHELALDGLVVIGGDGTLTIASRFFEMGVPVVGVPKTIDNDLLATEVTFGFDTALQTATDAIDKIHTTAESHNRIMVVEVMGRNAGWIALHAGIAGGADIILIPEIPFRTGRVCDKIRERAGRGRLFSIVVVAEGARPAEGEQRFQKAGMLDTSPRLGGIGAEVAARIEEMLKVETRVLVLGHLQRGGGPSPFDRFLSTRFGEAAVELIAGNRLGRMVCLRCGEIESVSLQEAAAHQRLVDPGSSSVRAGRAVGISFGD